MARAVYREEKNSGVVGKEAFKNGKTSQGGILGAGRAVTTAVYGKKSGVE